jgi:hypothetical protein
LQIFYMTTKYMPQKVENFNEMQKMKACTS